MTSLHLHLELQLSQIRNIPSTNQQQVKVVTPQRVSKMKHCMEFMELQLVVLPPTFLSCGEADFILWTGKSCLNLDPLINQTLMKGKKKEALGHKKDGIS
jgi:hypothetical protein